MSDKPSHKPQPAGEPEPLAQVYTHKAEELLDKANKGQDIAPDMDHLGVMNNTIAREMQRLAGQNTDKHLQPMHFSFNKDGELTDLTVDKPRTEISRYFGDKQYHVFHKAGAPEPYTQAPEAPKPARKVEADSTIPFLQVVVDSVGNAANILRHNRRQMEGEVPDPRDPK